MIKNERQYILTKKRIDDWEITYHQLLKGCPTGTAAWIHQAQIASVKQDLKQLKAQVREYEETKSGKRKLPDLNLVSDLPAWLIKWRIARNLTQKELAEKLGLYEQQIQRYENTDYAGASLATISQIAKVLRDCKPQTGRHLA